jgi:uncharacterized membrane protein YhaH (DUF805 family)
MSSTTDPWRAELTPRSRASRRRWTVVLAALLLVFGATALDDGFHDALFRELDGARTLLYVVMLFVVFGLLRRGTRRLGRLRGGHLGDIDERDTAARDRAFRTAFGMFLLVVVVTLFSLPAILPGSDSASDDPTGNEVLLDGDAVNALVCWLVAWAVFLPTAALAWREPDAPPVDDDDPRPVLGEFLRDGLVGASLLAGAAISASLPEERSGTEVLVAPLPFVVLAVVVGVLHGRRHGASWRRSLFGGGAVIGLILVVAVIPVLLLAASEETGGYVDETTGEFVEVPAGGRSGTAQSAPPPPGVQEVTHSSSSSDGSQRQVRCLLAVGRDGYPLEGAAARRMARRAGADPKRLCPDD